MNEPSLLWLLAGVGVGWAASQVWHRFPAISANVFEATSPAEGEAAVLKEQLRQTELAYCMAMQMSQFKGSFLARSSHELRSPLNGLIGMHQLILAELCDSPEEERDFITQAHASALKMVKVLDEVIDAAKVEHGTSQLALHPTDLSTLLYEVNGLTHLQAQNRNLRLTVVVPDSEIEVLVDSRRLRQALVMLVDSAIAHLEEGSITVTAESTGEYCQIAIATPIAMSVWSADLEQPLTCPMLDNLQPDKRTIVDLANQPFPLPSFSIAIARSLLQSMQGKLELVKEIEQPGFTRILCTVPLASSEAR
ncbi:MAG: sensor histidine kinase [Oscillatoriales cyanobacterium C42_A2020_001]|nr:sensor histidine kinase [Leptolyngbyaceae cyanobacterium C42_A2020_001]